MGNMVNTYFGVCKSMFTKNLKSGKGNKFVGILRFISGCFLDYQELGGGGGRKNVNGRFI